MTTSNTKLVVAAVLPLLTACACTRSSEVATNAENEAIPRISTKSLETMVVAARDLPAGTEITFDDLEMGDVPEGLVTESLVPVNKVQYLAGQKLVLPVRTGDPLRWGQLLLERRDCEVMKGRGRRTLAVSEPPTRILVFTRKASPGERLTKDMVEERGIPATYSSLDLGPAEHAEALYGSTILEEVAPGDPLRLSALAELASHDLCALYDAHCPATAFVERGAPAEVDGLTCPEGTEAVSGIPSNTLETCYGTWGWVFWCRGPGGEANGPYRTWHLDGTAAQSGRLCEGRPCGEWRGWSQGGELIRHVRYVAGVPHGEAMTGKGSEGTFADGVRTGRWVFTNEEKIIESTWSEGLASGLWRVKDESGRVRFEGRFEAGLPSGEWKAMDASGRVRGQWRFSHGELVEGDGSKLTARHIVVATRTIAARRPLEKEDLAPMVVPEIVSGAFATACDLGDVLEVRIPKGGFVAWEDLGPRLALDAVHDRPANPDTAHGSQ